MLKQAKTQANPLQNPEVVLNLWAFADKEGYIMRLAGKAYVMQGPDDQKLKLLKILSATDFLSAPWEKVQQNFSMSAPDGKSMKGVAHASMVNDPNSHSVLFGHVIDAIDALLPEQLRCVDGNYEKFSMKIPGDPLCVTTIVMEYEDGSLVPMVSGG